MIRTMENTNHMAFWEAIGAAPTPMAWNEVYFALQSGNIAAEENAADTIVGANLFEVQDYLACTNHILYVNQISINKDSWDALDPAYQEALQEAVNLAIEEMRVQLVDIDTQNKEMLVENGMTLIEYEPEFFEEVLAVPAVQSCTPPSTRTPTVWPRPSRMSWLRLPPESDPPLSSLQVPANDKAEPVQARLCRCSAVFPEQRPGLGQEGLQGGAGLPRPVGQAVGDRRKLRQGDGAQAGQGHLGQGGDDRVGKAAGHQGVEGLRPVAEGQLVHAPAGDELPLEGQQGGGRPVGR